MKIKQNKKQKPVYGVVNTKSLYVREGVGKEYNPLRSVPVITENEVTSEPVPAVVGIAIMGTTCPVTLPTPS